MLSFCWLLADGLSESSFQAETKCSVNKTRVICGVQAVLWMSQHMIWGVVLWVLSLVSVSPAATALPFAPLSLLWIHVSNYPPCDSPTMRCQSLTKRGLFSSQGRGAASLQEIHQCLPDNGVCGLMSFLQHWDLFIKIIPSWVIFSTKASLSIELSEQETRLWKV